MPVVNALIWLHFVGLVVGFAGGLGMSQVGPRLVAAAPDQRGTWWPLQNTFNRMAMAGLVVMLLTGPAVAVMKFGGFAALGLWFDLKMGLIVLALVAIGVSHLGKTKLKRGEEAGGKLMMASGRLTGGLLMLAMLAAVVAFN